MAVRLTKRLVEGVEAGASDQFLWDSEARGFGLKVTPKGARIFVCQYRTGGRGTPTKRATLGPFGTLTVEQARDAAKVILAKAAAGIDAGAEARAIEAMARQAREASEQEARLAHDLRFDRLAERWMAEHVSIKRKATTQAFYRLALDNHILPMLGQRDARTIVKQDIAKFHRGLAAKPTTANRMVAAVAAIFSWALKLEILPIDTRNPAVGIELFREQARERYLSAEELARLGEAIRTAETVGIEWSPRPDGKIKHAPRAEKRRVRITSEAAAALRLLLFTGARLREILHLEWSSVDIEHGLIRLRDSKTGAKTIILNAPARAVLASLSRNGRYVIPGEIAKGEDGNPQERPRCDLKRPWSTVSKAAGLSGLRLHDLRHSFASVGAGDGHGLTIIGKLLGHSQQRTTQRYAHLADDPLRKASDGIANRIAAAMGEAAYEPEAAIIPISSRGRG